MQITFQNVTISFHVDYGRGKQFKLLGTPEGHLTLKVPPKTSEAQIIAFMKTHETQLLHYHKKTTQRDIVHAKKQYDTTERYLVLGKTMALTDVLTDVPDSAPLIQMALKKHYTTLSKEIIRKRVKHFEKVIGVKARSITIVDSPKTWGTCNHLGDLTFNYKLSMATPNVIDYVIIHELTHILHLNHDRSFWRKVGAIDSNYKAHEDYLKQFGPFMSI